MTDESQRRYTLAELDAMRRSITLIHWPTNASFNASQRAMEVENFLRTHMQNGSSPEDLNEHATVAVVRRDIPRLRAMQDPDYAKKLFEEHFPASPSLTP